MRDWAPGRSPQSTMRWAAWTIVRYFSTDDAGKSAATFVVAWPWSSAGLEVNVPRG
jgi:hypothetical protein